MKKKKYYCSPTIKIVLVESVEPVASASAIPDVNDTTIGDLVPLTTEPE